MKNMGKLMINYVDFINFFIKYGEIKVVNNVKEINNGIKGYYSLWKNG